MKHLKITALLLALLLVFATLPALAESAPQETEQAQTPEATEAVTLEPLTVEASTATPVPESSPAPQPTLPITDKKDMPKPNKDAKAEAIVTLSTGTTLYETPSEMGGVVKQLDAGSVLTLKSLGLTWSEVHLGEDKGFVPTAALGFSYGSPQPVLALVTAPNGKLTLRADMTTKSKALLTLKSGRAVLLLARGETFSLVRYGEKEGYALTAHLKEMPVNEVPGLYTQVVSLEGKRDANVRIRLTPDRKGQELTRVKSGQYVVVIDQVDAEWSQVEYEGFSGYMMSDYLKKAD